MVRSMTGMGRGKVCSDYGTVLVEIKSTNSRSCSVNVKLPESISYLDIPIINYIKGKISRGQVNVSVEIGKDSLLEYKRAFINKELLKSYYNQIVELKNEIPFNGNIDICSLINLPGVLTVEENKYEEDRIWDIVRQAIDQALEEFIQMRTREGESIYNDISARSSEILCLISRIQERACIVVEDYKRRLQKRVRELIGDHLSVEDPRIMIEISIMLEKSDITEEIVRLKSHIEQIDSLRYKDDPIGRQLDFILQEANREVNTIASKSNDYQISCDCIKIKGEIEKIREQCQNLE